MNHSLIITPEEAVFLAGGAVLMLHKGVRSATGGIDRYTQLLGLSLLNRLSDEEFNNPEIQDMLLAAVRTGMDLTGDREEVHHENMDGVQATDTEKLM